MKKLTALLLITTAVFLLIGCFDLPTPEQVVQSDANGKDVRKLAGGSASNTPLHNGQTTRAKVIALLGPPAYESADGRSIGYASKTFQGFQFIALCGVAGPDVIRQYILRLDFDDHEVLKSYAIGNGESHMQYGFEMISEEAETREALDEALAKVNASGPELVRVKQGSVYPPATQP